MTPLHRLDIAQLRSAYRAGETTPAAVVDHYLARIDALDDALGAYIEIDSARAREAAGAAAARISAGTARSLEGVPIAVKANIAVEGLEWNAGMAVRRGTIAAADAEAVRRLRGAGAIILGTLNMHEAALGATTDNPWFGRTMNAHRPGYTPGGSSGGSGAAVAAGLCVAALGTDTLGSIRIPAAYNGVYGLKPTHGAVAAEGLVLLSESLDSIGPLARSLDDLAVVMRVLADIAEAPEPLRRVVLLDRLGDVECEPGVETAYARALDIAGDMPRTRLSLPDDGASIRLASFIIAARELAEELAPARQATPDRLSDELRFMLDYAAGRTSEEVAGAAAIVARTSEAVLGAVGTDGALLMPTVPQAAFAHGGRAPITQSAFTGLANMAGLPALSLPAGLDAAGLPVGVQLVGPTGREDALVALARRFDTGLPASPLM